MKKYFLLLPILLSLGLKAQQDLKTEEVEVISEYRPEISDAVKVNFPASIPDRNAAGKMELFYSTPVRLLQTPFSPAPLRPLAIGKEKFETYRSSYFKLGFGTQLTPLIEALWNEGNPQKFSYGAFFRHFSTHGLKIENQNYTDNYVSLFMNHFTKRSRLSSQFSYEREAVFYYGHNFDANDTIDYRKKDVRQRFNNIDWEAKAQNIINKNDFNYSVKIGYGFFGDQSRVKESNPYVTAHLTKIFKTKHYVSLFAKEDFLTFNNGNSSTFNILTVKPLYEYNDGTWKVFGGIDLTWENNIFHLFPDLGLERSLYENYIVMYNGWRMELRRTSYETLTEENPWINNDFELRNSWTEDRFLGLKGTVKNFSYNLRLGQKLIRRMPLYVNDPENLKMFDVIYDRRANILNFQAELFYNVNKNLNFNSTFEFYNYEMDTVDAPYHLPNFKFDLNAQYNIKEKIYLRLTLIARDDVKANIRDENGKFIELNGTFDASIGATYKFSKHFSFFADFNNLASIKYERYYLYPTYGFNALAGVIFTY